MSSLAVPVPDDTVAAPDSLALLTADAPTPPEPARLATADFFISLCLDASGQVHTTKAHFVATDESSVWAGWDAPRLLHFLHEHAALNVPLADDAAVPPSAAALREFLQTLRAELVQLQTAQPDAVLALQHDETNTLALHCGAQRFALTWPDTLEQTLGPAVLEQIVELLCESAHWRNCNNASAPAAVPMAEAATAPVCSDEALGRATSVATGVSLRALMIVPVLNSTDEAAQDAAKKTRAPFCILARGLSLRFVLSLHWEAVELPVDYTVMLAAQRIDALQTERLTTQAGRWRSQLPTFELTLSLPLAFTPGVYRITAQLNAAAIATQRSQWCYIA